MGNSLPWLEETVGTTTGAVARDVSATGLSGPAGEQHYSPKEIARRWGLSETKIRRIFEAESGVLRVGEPSRRVSRRLKRSHFTMRIPESVALRVHRRLSASRRTT